MSRARYLTGDVRDVMATIPDDTFDLVLTSPPFLALRSYLPADHPDKHREIGSEPTPAEFIDTLLALTAEWDRLLAPHGSIAVELGDTYSGSGGAGGDYLEGGMREGQQQFAGAAATMRESTDAHWRAKNAQRDAWPLDKSMCFIPHAYAMSLAYGRNILTGTESPAGSWRVRNVVAWCRPNPAVGALGDKFRPATSYMVIATKARDRYFDLDAVRTAVQHPNVSHTAGVKSAAQLDDGRAGERRLENNPAGAPPLDWWEIPTESYVTPSGSLVVAPGAPPHRERVPVGDIRRTTSPDCPVHGSLDRRDSSTADGEHGGVAPSHIARTDGRRDRAQQADSSPTSQTGARSGSSPASSLADGPAAKPHSTSSHRTDLAPSTNPAGTPSDGSPGRTAGTSEPRGLFDPDPDTRESSTSSACPPADEHETASSMSHISDQPSACCCSYSGEIQVESTPALSHCATWPSDYWNISTESFRGQHYATWPRKLLDRPILAMVPREVCTVCGEPRRRIVDTGDVLGRGRSNSWARPGCGDEGQRVSPPEVAERTTLGWSDCGHGSYRRGHVLDPFGGSGTTAAVAVAHGRDCTLIDLDERNVDLARERVGMFLEVPGTEDAA